MCEPAIDILLILMALVGFVGLYCPYLIFGGLNYLVGWWPLAVVLAVPSIGAYFGIVGPSCKSMWEKISEADESHRQLPRPDHSFYEVYIEPGVQFADWLTKHIFGPERVQPDHETSGEGPIAS